MKFIKYAALVLAVMMLSVAFIGCESVEKVTVNVTVSAVADGATFFGPVTLPVSTPVDEPATVLVAATLAMDENGIYYTITEDGLSLVSIGDYADTSDDEYTYFWEYTVNGVAPESGRAGTILVNENDVIVFNYVKILTSDLAAAGE